MPIADLAIGVAAGLITEALKRPFNDVAGELRRRDQIGRALTDRPSARSARQDGKLDAATQDLARVIGNAHGQLTERVSEFLTELRRTAFPEAIAQAALCGSDPSPLKQSFEMFCSRFGELPFTSDQLFDAYHQAVLARFEDVEDKALLDIIRAQHGDMVRQLRLMEGAFHAALNAHDKLEASDVNDARLRLAKAIEASNRYVWVETLQGAKKYKLKSLAIPGRLAPLSYADVQSAKVPEVSESINYSTFRRTFNRVVILGDPGGGKSTLTQLLCYDLANKITLHTAHPNREFDARDIKIPLRIILRSFEAKQARVPSYTFFDYLRDELRVPFESDEYRATNFLQLILGTGEAVVIFDGLDEVLDVGARRTMVSQIEQFSEVYAACPILVTSRLVGYRDAPLCEQFAPFGLARFNVEEVRKYAEKSICAVTQVKLHEARVRAQAFVAQTERVGGDLRENPLMLGLMVQIFVSRGDVPSNRPEVYQECAALMFDKWDGRREIFPDVPREDMVLLDVFGYVASRTFGDAISEEGVSKSWLTSELRKHFEGWYVDRASANRAAMSLVEFLTGRAWVMSEVGQEVYKFTHRTFLEYFFARNLISESRSIEELLSVELIPHVIKSEWVLIAHLALHMAIFRDGGKAKQAASTIERLLSELVLPAQQEMAFLEFVAAALEYIIIPEATYLNVVTLVAKRAVHLGARENVQAVSVILTLFQTAKHRVELAKSAICKTLDANLTGAVGPEMLFCIYALGTRRPEGYRDQRRRRRAPISLAWQSFDELRAKRRDQLLSLARNNPELARAYIYSFGDHRSDLFGIHGLRLIEANPSPLHPPGADQILSSACELVGAALINMQDISEINQDSELADCVELVRQVANSLPIESTDVSRFALSPLSREVVGNDLEWAFRNVWGSARSARRIKQFRECMADVLACSIYLADSLLQDENRSLRIGGRVRVQYFAPPQAIKSLIARIDFPARQPFFDNWLRLHSLMEVSAPDSAAVPAGVSIK